MNKALLTALATLLLAGLGGAFAQSSQQHNVTVNIPSMLRIRITDGSGVNPATNPSVTFDYSTVQADVATYMSTVNGGGGDLPPTSVSNFGDVVVFSNQSGTWRVTVQVTGNTGTFDPANIKITPGAQSGLSNESGATASGWTTSFALSTTATEIFSGSAKTQGWKSLGFNADDYSMHVDGTEDPGSSAITVQYAIANP